MDYLLQVKIGALVGLLLLTLLFGFIPARVKWFRDTNGTAQQQTTAFGLVTAFTFPALYRVLRASTLALRFKYTMGRWAGNLGLEAHRIVLSLISCFAGGVFLAACLLDIIPDYLSDISAELDAQKLETSFPLPEFIMAAGFFTVLILEKMVLSFRQMRGGHGERAPLLSENGHSHSHSGAVTTPDLESSGHHVHVDFQAHSPFRSFMLFLSLSLHSVFEGLAIGLQSTDSKVLEICIAILVHKSIIVFSLSVKLVQSAVRPFWIAAYIGVFALMSPLGIAIGISVMEARLAAGALIQAVLEGLAAGTFIYITFMEILPHELNSAGNQVLKVLFILLGFTIMAALTFLG